MRIVFLIALAISPLLLSGHGRAQSGSPPSDSSSTISTSPANPADDPAFAAFPPVTKDVKPPKAVSAPDPKFPDLPVDAEQRGTVVMLIGVSTKGRVEAVHVLRSDQPAFEKSAVETVKKWKFRPAQRNGHPVPVQVTVEMKFQR